MKAALLDGAAIAGAFILGVHVAAYEAPPAAGKCPWVASQAAAAQSMRPAQAPESQVPEAAPVRPATGGQARVPHPPEASECSEGAWKDFLVPSFDSQAACEAWVRENLAPRVLENLPPGESREFRFSQPDSSSGAILRSGVPLLI